MVRLTDIINNSKRINYEKNKKTHPIETKISPFFSWLFINLNMPPNIITILFFLIGLISAFLLVFDSLILSVFSYLLYRLHIILDVCDGEVARYTKIYSSYGKYLDLFTHQIVYPVVFIAMVFQIYTILMMSYIPIIGMFLVFLVCFRLSINGIVYRVNYSNNSVIEATEVKMASKIKRSISLCFANLTGFNCLFGLFIIVKIMVRCGFSNLIYTYFLWYAFISQFLYVLVKLFFVFKYNQIPRRDSLY